MQSDYGFGTSGTTTRKTMKSPQQQSNPLSIKTIDQTKHLKRKYEEVKHALNQRKQENFKLQQKLRQMQQLFVKRQREIEKKDSIHDALLYQIKSLNQKKSQKSQSSMKSLQNSKSNQNLNNFSADNDKRKINHIHFSTASQDSIENTSIQKVGGHFAKIFQLNNNLY